MKTFIVVLLLNIMALANTQPYKKKILIKELEKPTLVQVELDNELYQNSAYDYADIRLQSSQGIEGYVIKPFQAKAIKHQKTLTATVYDRKKTTLIYQFKEAFEIEEIDLHIEDRNFESRVDVYIDGKLYSQNHKIFDYANETGNQNFTIKIPKIEAKEVGIVYHLNQTTSFYKKYQHLKEFSQYLTIKSVTFSNKSETKALWNRTTIERASSQTEKKMTSYIFKTEGIPFGRLEVNILEKNFKREGKLYCSEDAEHWEYMKNFLLFSSILNDDKNEFIDYVGRTQYIKLLIDNEDNKALSINNIELLTTPNYLYFIANPHEKYTLYFGDKNLTKPSYELQSLLSAQAPYIQAKLSKTEKLMVQSQARQLSFFEKHKESIFIVVILLALLVMAYVAFGLLKRVSSK